MELKTVDPRSLIDNPDNPRGKAAPDHADEQMRLSIAAVGILQPPVVREMPKGLTVRYGSRRLRAALALKLEVIEVLVLGADERADDDQIRAVLENIARKQMSAVDQWRAIERLVSDRWTEEAISNVLVLTVRTIRKLRLLASILPAMLDRMHAGDMPAEGELRTIASAATEEQAAAWKKNKPKKGERVSWWALADALKRREMKAADALFDADYAEAYGVSYIEDLFAPADEDSRTTTNVDGFLSAQQAWIEANLPERGVILSSGQYGEAKLPRDAIRTYSKPGPEDHVGYHLEERTGKMDTIIYRLPKAQPSKGAGVGPGAAGADADQKKPRAAVTQKGEAMIGDMRTDALHAALRDEPITDDVLIGLLVLALGGNNVEIKTGIAGWNDLGHGATARIAGTLAEGDALTQDPTLLREIARTMLVHALSCRENHSSSGHLACVAAEAIGADAHLPNMATVEFLSCLSKGEIETVAISLNVPVQPTGKATRGAVVARAGGGRWVHPTAAFAAGTTPAATSKGSTFVPGWNSVDTASDADEADADAGSENGGDPAGQDEAEFPDALDVDDQDDSGPDDALPDPARLPRPAGDEVRTAA